MQLRQQSVKNSINPLPYGGGIQPPLLVNFHLALEKYQFRECGLEMQQSSCRFFRHHFEFKRWNFQALLETRQHAAIHKHPVKSSSKRDQTDPKNDRTATLQLF